MKGTFVRYRKKISVKLQNPRLISIHFHTLRHWKATMEYHTTKDLLHVMAFLGHKKSDNTLLYVQLDEKLFANPEDDQWTVKAVHNEVEAIKLGEWLEKNICKPSIASYVGAILVSEGFATKKGSLLEFL